MRECASESLQARRSPKFWVWLFAISFFYLCLS
jgi:hypothetical protein